MNTLIKSSLKLLFRNKSFWFFLVVIPLVSTLVLNINQTNSLALAKEAENRVVELENEDEKVAYFGGTGAFVVKVYDTSGSELSESLLTRLASEGIFVIARDKAPEMDKASADARIANDGQEDRMGAAIYLSRDFDTLISEGKENDALTVYVLSEDERISLLENSLKKVIGEMQSLLSQNGIPETISILKQRAEALPEKEIITISGSAGRVLTVKQENQKTTIGYAFSFMTLGYVFAGIFIAHTVIKEEHDKVLTRLYLTGTHPAQYFAAKFIVNGIATTFLTVMLGVCTLFLDEEQFGMSRLKLLLMMFLLGLIFSAISLVMGVLMGDVMNANIAAFALFSMSSLLAGTFFQMDATSKMIKALSLMMPQKWFMDASEMILVSDNRVYFMLLCVTAGYLILTLSVGSVGIKFRNGEE